MSPRELRLFFRRLPRPQRAHHRLPERPWRRFLRRAVGWYAERGITIERVLSDNGNAYRSYAWRHACSELKIQRRYTRSRRPQNNGKADALVKTLLREWA